VAEGVRGDPPRGVEAVVIAAAHNFALTTLAQIAGDNLEWTNQTNIHPLGLIITLLCGFAVLLVDRRYAVWPFIFLACMVAPAQRLVIGGLDFSLLRIMVLFGFARIITRVEYGGVKWSSIDGVIIAFAIVRTMIYTIQQASVSALINQAGQTFDTVGMYFLFRCLVRNWDDAVRMITGFVAISTIVAVAFFLENRTGRNAFAFFGGVPAITEEREGRLRCQGAFAHPIIAGCFWATMLPMVVAQWWRGGTGKMWAAIGTGSMLAIVFFSASSTPVLAVAFGVFGAAMFFVRWWMRYVCMGAVALLVFLHMSMQQPVWHLISRITIARGNTGYHRFELIDNAIKRFGEWALIGTRSTSHWFWSADDVTNQYILEGVRGGAATLILFIATIWLCFRAVGRLWRSQSKDKFRLVFAWSLGVALFAHCTNFIAVSYFGQSVFGWYLLLAVIASLDEFSRFARRAVKPRRGPQQPSMFGPHSPWPGLAGMPVPQAANAPGAPNMPSMPTMPKMPGNKASDSHGAHA
jgi:hypothetical protein